MSARASLAPMPDRQHRFASALFFAAVMVPVAIIIHLGAEYAGIGGREFTREMYARHIYLVIAGIAALVAGAYVSRLFAPATQRRERLALLLTGLPFGGSGARFIGLCFGTQIALFAGSQAIEGCPIAAGDAVTAVLLAIMLSSGAALALGTLPERAVKVLTAVYLSRLPNRTCNPNVQANARFEFAAVAAPLLRIYLAVIGNRPPPVIETRLLARR